MRDCPKCLGCGRLSDTENPEPWSMWESLPLKSAGAVLLGLVKPIACPRCKGTGRVGEHCDTCTCESD